MNKLKKRYFVQSILIISGAYPKGEFELKHNDGFLTIGGSRRCTKDVVVHLGPICFIFMQSSAKILAK